MSFASTYSSLSIRGFQGAQGTFGFVNKTTVANTNYGVAVSISGDGNFAVIGQSGNSVGNINFLEKNNNNILTNIATFGGVSGTNVALRFGTFVSMSENGDWTIVGPDPGATTIGYIRFYSKSGNTFSLNDTKWHTPNVAGTRFGQRVFMTPDGTFAATTTTSGNANIGVTVQIFENVSNTWSLHSNIDYGITLGSLGGLSLSSNANILVLGIEPNDVVSNVPGSVDIYTRSNTTWTLAQTITASDGSNRDGFGTSVDINPAGNIILVSAPYIDDGATSNVGALYLFTYDVGNSTWIESNKIISNDISANQNLGYAMHSVDMTSNAEVIVASTNLANYPIYIFQKNDNTYVQSQTIYNSNISQTGYSISITDNGNILLTGTFNIADSSVYQYNLS